MHSFILVSNDAILVWGEEIMKFLEEAANSSKAKAWGCIFREIFIAGYCKLWNKMTLNFDLWALLCVSLFEEKFGPGALGR